MSEIRTTKIDGVEFVTLTDYLRLKEEKEKIDQLISSGELSDGYHTFNSLYHQRAILFATIVNMNRDKSWKSKKHSDGKYCFDKEGEWFIVGIDTPKGSYTYHYETDRYWDLFKCEELELGKERDGHTEKDVDRLLSLGNVVGNLKHRIRQLSDECERLQYLYDKIERLEEENKKLKECNKSQSEVINNVFIPQKERLKEELKSLVKKNIELNKKYMIVLTENKNLKSDYDRLHKVASENVRTLDELNAEIIELKKENKKLQDDLETVAGAYFDR